MSMQTVFSLSIGRARGKRSGEHILPLGERILVSVHPLS